jgi:hypothetical protein
MNLAKLRDQPHAIGDEVKDDELVWITPNGLYSSWHNFVQVIYGREMLPNFEKLWDAFIEEKMRLVKNQKSQPVTRMRMMDQT